MKTGLAILAAALLTAAALVPALPATAEGLPAGDPSLAEMNAAGNHTMGSTIPASDPAAAAKSSKFAAALAVSGVQGQDVSGWQVGVDWAQQ